ncbi:Surp-domain-containing protein [Ascobolus immersus RN42]|uniref:Surp-domain-containing protein n=1 Tax=Ascobolus immersus RN42 TaxID=1160509 RepID=A0A3N4I6R5_ASCIM|nr:Surp-domain-containing protein [Ascobolus immersus RN42]
MENSHKVMPSGMVLPPKEIKAIIEKTAKYVARNGLLFEQRIRDKESNNAKFSFLSPADAYYSYYKWRMEQIKGGEVTIADRVLDSEIPKKVLATAKSQPVFASKMPNLCSVDLDVIRLVAQFGSYLGRSFVTALCQRESRNPQFDFLRPNHSYHQFFMQQLDQYTAARTNGRRGITNVGHRKEVLTASREKALTAREDQLKAQKLEAETRKENIIFAQIDWHDFSVVEIIQFQEGDEHALLPAPLDLNQLLNKSLEEKAHLVSQDGRGLLEFDASAHWEESTAEQTSPAQQNRTVNSKVMKTTCPNCGALIPIDELEEHMRIELLSYAR